MAKTLKQKSVNQLLYISIGSAIAILILFIIIFNVISVNGKNQDVQLGDNQNNETPSIEQASYPIGKTVNEVEDDTVAENLTVELSENSEDNQISDENQVETSNNINETANETTAKATEVTNENAGNVNSAVKEEIEEEETPEPVFIKPVEGEIMKQYGKEKLLYSNTLKEWTTHLGIDIKADKTSVVKAATDGKIKSIKNDPRYGLTIVIEHEKGYSSIYANLLSAEFVTVGEKVKSGQTIGTVGNSATFEILDEPHLHFEILKDGVNIDPEMCIK